MMPSMLAPASIQKELQRTAALACSDLLSQAGMKEKDQWDRMFDSFHGEEGDNDAQ